MMRSPRVAGVREMGMPSPLTVLLAPGVTTSVSATDSVRPSSVATDSVDPHSASASDSRAL